MNKRDQKKARSWAIQSAHRAGAGPHNDKRKVRAGTRCERVARAVRESAAAAG
jgi:hypothetical protein